MNHAMHHLKLLDVEGHQIEEALNAIIHSILFHRSTGKENGAEPPGSMLSRKARACVIVFTDSDEVELRHYTYKADGKYSVGTVGMEDVDCERFDLTYIRIPSKELINRVTREISTFSTALRSRETMNSTGEPISGQVSLQFYQKNKAVWPRSDEHLPWEDWVITVNIVSLANENERQVFSETLSRNVGEIIMNVIQIVNTHDVYVPKDPKQQDLDSVYETSLTDIQPYLFKVSNQLHGGATSGEEGILGATVKKLAQALS